MRRAIFAVICAALSMGLVPLASAASEPLPKLSEIQSRFEAGVADAVDAMRSLELGDLGKCGELFRSARADLIHLKAQKGLYTSQGRPFPLDADADPGDYRSGFDSLWYVVSADYTEARMASKVTFSRHPDNQTEFSFHMPEMERLVGLPASQSRGRYSYRRYGHLRFELAGDIAGMALAGKRDGHYSADDDASDCVVDYLSRQPAR